MMAVFIADHNDELVARCIAKVAKRPRRDASTQQLENGVPLFLDQLRRTLEAEETGRRLESIAISGASGGVYAATSQMGVSASQHGKMLSELGYTVDQVVHDYGDLCQAITELAVERDVAIETAEFRTLNRCLDNAIARAVAAFSEQEDAAKTEAVDLVDPRQHRLRNSLSTALYAAMAMELGDLSISGSTGYVLRRSLEAMRLELEVPPAQ